MAASQTLTALIDNLVALFNRGSMDLPHGYFTRHTQFLLNGVPFEEMLGRPASDPLVLMLARGPAGYRFTAKAVQHAIPGAQLQRGDLAERTDAGAQILSGECWLSGHYRATQEPAEVLIGVEMTLRGGVIERVNARIEPAVLARLHDARLRS